MKLSPFVDGFDLDITLRDTSVDPDNTPNRRAIANLSLSMEVNDAYYSVRELREAVCGSMRVRPAARSGLRPSSATVATITSGRSTMRSPAAASSTCSTICSGSSTC